MQNDNGSYGSDIGNKGDNVIFLNGREASDLLDCNALGAAPLRAPAMERSAAGSLGAHSVDIGEITESPDTEYMSTSAILHYCKSKILLPYLKLLTVMGLRPVADASSSSRCAVCLSHYHTAQVAAAMCAGYVLQYMACFRRDRGLCDQPPPPALASSSEYEQYKRACYGSAALTFAGPGALHLAGFLCALYVFRVADNEQLQSLMERVFLLSSYAPRGAPAAAPRRLLRVLWLFIVLSVVWMGVSLLSVSLALARSTVVFKWMESSSPETKLGLKILLIICTLTHDMVHATVISSYCLQAQLLRAHLTFLNERLLNRTITPLNWMREISEFKKLLKHLNEELAPAVCLFTVVSLAWAAAGAARLLRADAGAAGALRVLLWGAAGGAPLAQAARLSRAGARARGVGHALAARPFAHAATPREDVCGVLAFAAALRLRARLCGCAVRAAHACVPLALALVALFALAMCHVL